jgi:hypothetical protein
MGLPAHHLVEGGVGLVRIECVALVENKIKLGTPPMFLFPKQYLNKSI